MITYAQHDPCDRCGQPFEEGSQHYQIETEIAPNEFQDETVCFRCFEADGDGARSITELA